MPDDDTTTTNPDEQKPEAPTTTPPPDAKPDAQPSPELKAAQDQAANATAKYLDLARSTNPTIPTNLIAGDTIDAIDASLTAAKATVAQVLDANKTDTTQAVNTGAAAPPRNNTGAPPAGTTGIARLRHALNHPDK